jgi:hypothetical protein
MSRRLVERGRAATEAAAPRPASTETGHLRLLVIERHAGLRGRYRRDLAARGYRVACAADTREARRLIAGERPDVVLLAGDRCDTAQRRFVSDLLGLHPDTAVVFHRTPACLWADFSAWAADGAVRGGGDLGAVAAAVSAASGKKAVDRRSARRIPS